MRLERYELQPFRAAISQGVLSVMVGHLAVPKLTGTMEPASLSRAIVTSLLRDELGFKGLVVTDALNMKALHNGQTDGDIAIRAVHAGNDILLYPEEPEVIFEAVCAAVERGDILESRLDHSVRRILQMKRWLGLDHQKLVDLSRLNELVGTPANERIAEKIAEDKATLREAIRKRRQAAEKQAKMAPLKMTFPLLFFILPALIIILMGPAVISVIRTFRQ